MTDSNSTRAGRRIPAADLQSIRTAAGDIDRALQILRPLPGCLAGDTPPTFAQAQKIAAAVAAGVEALRPVNDGLPDQAQALLEDLWGSVGVLCVIQSALDGLELTGHGVHHSPGQAALSIAVERLERLRERMLATAGPEARAA